MPHFMRWIERTFAGSKRELALTPCFPNVRNSLHRTFLVVCSIRIQPRKQNKKTRRTSREKTGVEDNILAIPDSISSLTLIPYLDKDSIHPIVLKEEEGGRGFVPTRFSLEEDYLLP